MAESVRDWRSFSEIDRELAAQQAKPLPGARFLTELLPGEDWRLVDGIGIVIVHPDRPAVRVDATTGERIPIVPG